MMAKRKITLERIPLPVELLIYIAGLFEIFAAWTDVYVTHPFVYNKF